MLYIGRGEAELLMGRFNWGAFSDHGGGFSGGSFSEDWDGGGGFSENW